MKDLEDWAAVSAARQRQGMKVSPDSYLSIDGNKYSVHVRIVERQAVGQRSFLLKPFLIVHLLLRTLITVLIRLLIRIRLMNSEGLHSWITVKTS